MPEHSRGLLAELERCGELYVFGPGRLALAGRLLAVWEFFDGRFRALARRLGAVPHEYPDLIATDHLDRVEFFDAFPHLTTFAAPFECPEAGTQDRRRPRLAAPECAMAPAVCYHTYASLSGRCLPVHPYTVTARGRCCRYEGSATVGSPTRLWSFTMREIVAVGTAGEVVRIRRRLSRAVGRLAAEFGIPHRVVPASDPFFLPTSRAKVLAQRLQELKLELRAPVDEGPEIALASFNLHHDFFGQRMQISLPSGEMAHSGCTAFGLERWAYAFLYHNGIDPDYWPAPVRRHYTRHAAR